MMQRLRELLGGQIPFYAFAALGYGFYRKPNAGMWTEFLRLVGGGPVDLSRSFFVGDAAGRPADFSACDRQFAANCGYAQERERVRVCVSVRENEI